MARSDTPLAGTTVLVTGANRGIGRASAAGLAALGARVVLLCRDRDAGAAAAADIRRRTANAEVYAVRCDLASKAETRRAAEEILERFDRAHVLITNAGIYTRRREATADGFELQFGVNHLGHFLLTHLLLDRLTASAPARIIVVSSEAHHDAQLDFDDLQWRRRRYDPKEAYACSKLANVLFTYELARRLEGTGVTANALHPGVIATNMVREYVGLPQALEFTLRASYKSPEQGARTSIYLASSPEVAGVTGRYFINRRERRSSPESYDREAQTRLWEVSEGLTAG